MKKNLFLVAALFAGSVAFAQTTEVKDANGFVVTPQAGDWALGFNASPLVNYVGNMFNGNLNNTLNAGYVSPNQAIYGKYFKDENTAYRASIRLGSGSGTQIMQVDTSTVSSNPSYVENKVKTSGSNIVLSVGLEKRKGHNKLQGYYGAEASITFAGANKMKYTYGADLDSVNMSKAIVGFADNGRTLSSKGGGTFGVGVRGFIGAEYFFAPKISIAAEYGWGLSLARTSGTELVTENYGHEDGAATNSTFEVTTNPTARSSSFGIDTDNLGGAIRLMFHF